MILFSSEAISDIERVRNFLSVRNPDAALRAMRAIWRALERVESFPEIGHFTKDRAAFDKLSCGSAAADTLFAIESCLTRQSSSRVSGMVARRGKNENRSMQ